MTKRLKVAVLYGGKSVEHEVSVHSAETVSRLLSKFHDVVNVFIDKRGRWFLQENCGAACASDKPISPCFLADGARVDVVFPVLHGANGEDGRLQGLLEMLNLPYVGCGVTASAVAMDKEISKILAAREGVAVVPWAKFSKDNFDINSARRAAAEFGYPVFVKPRSLGSSVGVSKVKEAKELETAFNEAFKFEKFVLLERGVVPAREIFISLYSPSEGELYASEPAELKTSASDFFDYHAKYEDPDGCLVKVPAGLPAETAKKMKEDAAEIFKTLGCAGLARVDFLLGEDGAYYFSEINTLPGMSEGSLFPQTMRACGFDYAEILNNLVLSANTKNEKTDF